MDLKEILNAIETTSAALVPFFPPAKFIEIGSDLGGKIVAALSEAGTTVKDENGNVLSKEELAFRVQARWDLALAGLDRIADRARNELGRTDVPATPSPNNT